MPLSFLRDKLPAPPSRPSYLDPAYDAATRVRDAAHNAFPPVGYLPPYPPSLQSHLSTLGAALLALSACLDRGGPRAPYFCAEAQHPSIVVDVLSRALHYRRAPEHAALMRAGGAVHVNATVVFTLRAMNAMSAASELLAMRLATSQVVQLLFDAMLVPGAKEIALGLVEEMLHVARGTIELDLACIPHLATLVHQLSPFQLASFCRVLAPLVDERELPLCGGDHCSGNCAMSSGQDWQLIEPAANQLRSRRSYVGSRERVLRERNHAALLAIPGLIKKLVQLVAVPPAPRSELVMVDHALRSGIFTFNYDLADAMADSPHPVTLHAALVADVREEGQAEGEIVIEQVLDEDNQTQPTQVAAQNQETTPTTDPLPQAPEEVEQEQHDGETVLPAGPVPHAPPHLEESLMGEIGGRQLTPEEEMRRQVLLMVFRRVTGMDNDDKDQAGTDKWEILEKRIERAAVDHAMGHGFEKGVFRERRRRPSQVGGGTGVRMTGDRNGVLSFEAVVTNQHGQVANTANGASEQTANQPEGSGHPYQLSSSPRGRSRRSRHSSAPNDDDDDDNSTAPHMSINALLMATHQVEAMFVLFSLLTGRRRADVQAAMIDAGIFSVLNRFCDALDWKDSSRETKTEESLKVHFVRLLHYMCDGLGSTRPAGRLEWLFSEYERSLLESIEEGKTPILPGVETSLIWRVSPPPRDSILVGMQNLSISSPSSSNCATPSHSIQSEMEPNGRHFQCPPNRSDNLNQAWDDDSSAGSGVTNGLSTKTYYSPTYEAPLPKLGVEELSPCLTPKSSIFANNRPGVICKVAKILIEDCENARRFLVSGCIETFLRSASASEKTLIAHQGLLKHLIDQLSESANRIVQVSQFRQTSFDLLGQLVKWNRELFRYMNEIFQLDGKLLKSLLKAVSDRLVDSNVFVRSIVISLERFRAEDELQKGQGNLLHEPYDFDNCLLWDFVEECRHELVYDLLCSVRVKDVNFENICCVNTTLIVLVVSCPDTEALDEFLGKVAEITVESIRGGWDRPQSLFGVNPVNVFENFKKLVEFWKSYYQFQGLDVASQEMSSNIHFDRLVLTADLVHERLGRLDEEVRKEAKQVARRLTRVSVQDRGVAVE